LTLTPVNVDASSRDIERLGGAQLAAGPVEREWPRTREFTGNVISRNAARRWQASGRLPSTGWRTRSRPRQAQVPEGIVASQWRKPVD
jgi:hypothetical protein